MRIGVPKEIKVHEYRVGLTPASVREVVAHGHEVLVETAAAERIGVSDDDYRKAGAKIAETAAEVFAKSELIVKVIDSPKLFSRGNLGVNKPNTDGDKPAFL